MADMAMQPIGAPLPLKDIARRQQIPPNYLEQIFSQLRAAGLVRSIRGARGGFALGRSPSDIRMADIAAVFEGSIDLIGCASDSSMCNRSLSCAIRQVWIGVGECMKKALDSVTLEEVANLQGSRDANATRIQD